MQARQVVPFALAAVIFGVAAVAMTQGDRRPPDAQSTPELNGPSGSALARREPDPSRAAPAPGPAGPLASHAVMGSENTEPPGVAWTVPAEWEAVPNPNGMRLATYRVRGTATNDGVVDISVARAGGSPDANIDRWLGQFDADPTVRRNDTTISDLSVTLVDIHGTYRGGGMMPGAPPNPRPGWTLLAAIVSPSAGSPYFFKVLGPTDAVQKARQAFTALVESLQPDPG
jgi:hypothetical protein